MKKYIFAVATAILTVTPAIAQTEASSPQTNEWTSTIVFEEGQRYIDYPIPFDGYSGTLVFPETTTGITWMSKLKVDPHIKNPTIPEGYRWNDGIYPYEEKYLIKGWMPGAITVVCKAVDPPSNSYIDQMSAYPSKYHPSYWGLKKRTLYVPLESILSYKIRTDFWSQFGTIRPISEYYAQIGGIEEDDAETPAEYYTLNGIRLSDYPQQNGIYIERRGNSSRKIIITDK